EARDPAEGRRLPASRGPEQREELAAPDREIEVVDRYRGAEALGDPFEADRFGAGAIAAGGRLDARVGGRVVCGHPASPPISTFCSPRRPSRRGSATAKATIRNEITSIRVPIALIVGRTPNRIEE